VENGKLIVTSENQQYAGITLQEIKSDQFAVEFDLQILNSSMESQCIFASANEYDYGDASHRAIGAMFLPSGQAGLAHYKHPNQYLDLVISENNFDFSKSSTVTLIFLGDQIAAYIDGQLAYTVLDPEGSAVYTRQGLAANYTAQCEYDNFKIWDLSRVDFSASIQPASTSTPDLRVLNPANQHLYLLSMMKVTWSVATSYCTNLGGHLVTIQDSEENDFIITLITDKSIWLGATDAVKEGIWTWVSGEPWEYTNWAGGQPDNILDREDVLSFGDTAWNDLDELESLFFVCEWESVNSSLSTSFTPSPTIKKPAFYEPILAYLAEGHTSFQDNFSSTDKNYTGGIWNVPNEGTIWLENGYRLIQNHEAFIEMTFPKPAYFNATDFAIQYDAAFVGGNQMDGFGLYFRGSSNLDTNYKILFTSSNGGWILTQDDGTVTELGRGSSSFDPYEFTTFLIIAKQENLAILVNGKLIIEVNNLEFSGIYNFLVATASQSRKALKLDNFKFWNLNGLDFNP
jgi:hypothetical protein